MSPTTSGNIEHIIEFQQGKTLNADIIAELFDEISDEESEKGRGNRNRWDYNEGVEVFFVRRGD